MDIKYFIEPIFKIEFFKIKCIKFKEKKIAIEKVLKNYPEKSFLHFYSNRNKANIIPHLQQIFKDEFSLISTKYGSKIKLDKACLLAIKKVVIMFPIIMALLVIVVFYI